MLRVIEELNYKPNRLASNLRRMSAKTIMVVLPDITNPFFAKIVQGFEDVAHERGYYVLLGDTGNRLSLEREFIELSRERAVDGLILATARIPNKEIQEVSEHVPLVLACEYVDGLDIPTVSIDNVGAARAATEFLIESGHRRVAHISGPMAVVLSRDRVKGYRQAVQLHDLELDDRLIQEGDFTVQSGYHNMLKLLSLDNPPTAVFAANDEMAVGAIKAAKSLGIRVPEDLSVIGFDDIPLAMLVEPELTTVHQPQYDIGRHAMRMLLDIVEGRAPRRRQVVLSHRIVVRGSTMDVSGSEQTGNRVEGVTL